MPEAKLFRQRTNVFSLIFQMKLQPVEISSACPRYSKLRCYKIFSLSRFDEKKKVIECNGALAESED